MKALVLWCRWHNARLRLQGRDDNVVWGELAFAEQTKRFRYELASGRLTIAEGEGQRELLLDEMGVELEQS